MTNNVWPIPLRLTEWNALTPIEKVMARTERVGECLESRSSLTGTGSEYRNGAWIDGRPRMAHVIACEAAHGPAPAGKPCALHTCDNPSCVRGSHLYWGDRADNTRDKVVRGRTTRGRSINVGERHGMSKLSDRQRDEIAADTRPQKVISEDYGVTQGTVSTIQRRREVRRGDALRVRLPDGRLLQTVANESGVGEKTARARVSRGWSVELACTVPIRKDSRHVLRS